MLEIVPSPLGPNKSNMLQEEGRDISQNHLGGATDEYSIKEKETLKPKGGPGKTNLTIRAMNAASSL
jgi:hypothetical protein